MKFMVDLSNAPCPGIVLVRNERCGPCQILSGELNKLAAEYGSRLCILKVDTEEEDDLATLLAIRGLPTLMFVQGGKLVYRMEGKGPCRLHIGDRCRDY